jgi:salicylate hydroxylase
VLLGDAAQAMLPHHGQGANTTIEDAVTLAELLAGAAPDDLDTALDRYQALRRARTRKIQRRSWATNRLLHLPDGPALAERGGRVSRFPERFGWIHEFDVLRSASEPKATERTALERWPARQGKGDTPARTSRPAAPPSGEPG